MWTSTPRHYQISGLITRARAHQLNNQVSSFLASYSSYLDNGNMCSILLIVMATPTTYGLGFRHANTYWKAPGVYFHMHPTSSPYHVGADRNHHFGAGTFSANGATTPYFSPLGRVSC
jgi:hypothetical protein